MKKTAEEAVRNDPTKIVDKAAIQKKIDSANHDIDNLKMRKILSPDDVKKIKIDARASRLKTIFNSLEPDDALEVWDAATDDEKKELDTMMQTKFMHWREKLSKDGKNPNSLNSDDQDMFNRLRKASAEAHEIRNRPEPPPLKPKPAQAAAK
jgi:hypothetical protein